MWIARSWALEDVLTDRQSDGHEQRAGAIL